MTEQPGRAARISRWRVWRRLRSRDAEPNSREGSSLRKLRRDPWRSRNAWDHGDPPGVNGLH